MIYRPTTSTGRSVALAASMALAACSSSSVPPGAGADSVATLALGDDFGCARSAGGAVKCWGHNDAGQLGQGAFDPVVSVTPLPVPGLSGVTALAAGGLHACAISAGGAVACWGANETGEVGLDPATNPAVNAPSTVAGATGATALTAGAVHTCALMDDRRVKCWGYNNLGELGVTFPAQTFVPQYVTSLTSVVSLAAGTGHTCAVLNDGHVKCWGANDGSQLGDPNVLSGTSTSHSADPVFAGTLATAVEVAAGEGHSCARLASGKVACWGRNRFGVLGRPGSGPDPVEVASISGATAIASGDSHACALVAGGTVRCWGYNYYGQLGSAGAGLASADPLTVTSLSGATGLAAGRNHTCAILGGGGVRCWGRNDYGQLGGGTPFGDSF